MVADEAYEDEAEFLKEWVERLRNCGKAVIVEGKRDRAALGKFGIKNIFTIGTALYDLAENVSSEFKRAVILTDLDSEGKTLYAKLKTELARLGVEVDNRFREELFMNTRLSQMEGFDSYYERIVGEKFG